MIKFESTGSFNKTESFLASLTRIDLLQVANRMGAEGVAALAAATPAETGLTAESWTYEVTKEKGGVSINWINTNLRNGTPIAILIQYGHGTGTGGYVAGRDYINPALKPIFDKYSDIAWKAVTSA